MDTLQVEYRKVNVNKTKTGKNERQGGATRQFVTTETKQNYYENRKYWIQKRTKFRMRSPYRSSRKQSGLPTCYGGNAYKP